MVLIAGGTDASSTSIASSELYDLVSMTWTATDSLNTARAVHTAVLLQNGGVLVTGGVNPDNRAVAMTELGQSQH
jgi:hypothetical protein